MNKKIFFLGVVLLIMGRLFAVHEIKLITLSADGTETSYALPSVQRIVFENNTMTVNMKSGADATNIVRVSFLLEIDYSNLKINEVSGVGEDSEKFYELINIGTEDIPLEGCRIYYNANGSVGQPFPPNDERLTWTGDATQVANAGELFCLIGRGNPGSFTTGLTPERILIITLKDPAGNVLDQCIRAEDTGIYAVGRDKSFSRIPDGTGPFYFTTPTPEQLNGDDATGLLLVPQKPVNVHDNKGKSSLFLFPNPVKTNLTLSGVTEGATINLIDMNGRLLQSIITQDDTADINVSSLPQGSYLLQVGKQVIKFIKQ